MTEGPPADQAATDPDDDRRWAQFAHAHHHVSVPAPRRAVRLALATLIPAAVITVVGLVWLWPNATRPAPEAGQTPQRVAGTVVAVHPEACPAPQPGLEPPPGTPVVVKCGTVAVRLADGPHAGTQVTTDIPSGPGAPSLHAGDKVVLFHLPDSPTGWPYQILDHERGLSLWALAAAFALAVVAFGRWRGVRALAGLTVTFTVLLLFVVPAILAGRSPLLVAIVGSAAIMLSVLYLTHGFSVPTSVAVLGTLASLTLTGLLASASVGFAELTGVASEEAGFLSVTFHNVNMRGLLLAGIVIGSLGVLDDVAVTQASTVTELAHANPDLTAMQLYRAASRVGRAHIASVINTIILAYVGASLPVLLLLAAGNQPVGELLTNQLLAEEIVRSVVGTIGLIAAVPITTALAALTAVKTSTHATNPRHGS